MNQDICFREAGFTDFGDADERWDAEADDLLTRLLAELSLFGAPRMISEPARQHIPWYRRPFAIPEVIDLRQQIELPIQWDNLPDCIVGFGESDVTLRTGKGHQIFWIVLPEHVSFDTIARRVAGAHPLVQTELRWERLI